MVLESTIVCVDNSEYSRNGDFAPTRFASQVDSVNMLCQAKVDANAESSVGLLTLAGPSARILVTSTRDMSHIFTSLHDVKHDGLADVVAGIQKARLALKHRQNPLQRQRIVVFVASPIPTPVQTLVRLGKTLKKNSVAVDVINVGVEGENVEKIDAFIAAVNSDDNSHVLHVPAGGSNLADTLMNSDVFHDHDAVAAAARAASSAPGAPTADFGMDGAGADPELEMVLRMSMEEERARQAAAAAASATPDGQPSEPLSSAPQTDQTPAAASGAPASGKYDDDDADLYGTADQMDVDDAEDEEEMLRRAIELSKADAEKEEADRKQDGGADGGSQAS